MSGWMQLLALVGAGFIVWYAFRLIKRQPGLFSKKNIESSFFTLGLVALGIIAVIAICVLILKHT